MAKPPLNGVAETEYTKSQQGGLAPSSFRTSCGVHELVARVMRGKCVRQRTEQKSAVLLSSAISTIPRVRTYHTRKPSRFVHALSARPHNRCGGRGSNMFADRMESAFLLFLLAIFGLYLVGELTHMRSMCVGVAETGAEHRSPAKKHNATFLFSYFSMTKSYLRGVFPLSRRAKAPLSYPFRSFRAREKAL